MKKITICGVPGSDNLGDAVIADCLAAFFEGQIGVKANICDISYREAVVYDGIKGKSLSVFNKFPRFFRQIAVWLIFSLKFQLKGKQFLSEKMKGASLVIIGGGQLISDVDWNFPLKLYFVTKIAEKLDIPIQIASVGVAKKWSWIGKIYMGKVFNSKKLLSIGVRDQLSKDNLNEFFNLSDVTILPDPVVMCSLLKSVDSCQPISNIVGVGVADLDGLNYSSDLINEYEENSLDKWVQLVGELTGKGKEVVLFTNGAAEDERFMNQILVPYLTSKNNKFRVNQRFSSSEDMINFIAGLSACYAFRLHANIIAASYSVAHFAIGWDNKLISFFKMQGRSESVYSSLSELVEAVKSDIIEQKYVSKITPESVLEQYVGYFEKNIET